MGIIETLQAEIQSLKDRVTALEQLTKGSDAQATSAPALRQLTRDDIIEMAKRDVVKLEMDAQQNLLRAIFIVNREKRTIVCLLERFDLGYIKARGIAKCHPDDCFNAAIGRAIALRRALGLEVPEAYLNAPQPTEVKRGGIVYLRNVNEYVTAKGGWLLDELNVQLRHNDVKIIDDTREEV